MEYSVLMSVYMKEKAEFLKAAVESMLNQTICTNDFVIICDGPLTKELDDVISRYKEENPDLFQIVRLKTNQGLGNALRIGVEVCKNELIARMDSDDISCHDRCEKQLEMFKCNDKLCLCSGFVKEFIENQDDALKIKKVPLNNADIYKYAKKRNPINHMAVMFKKSKVLEAGNYIELNLGEDYYLWVRMLYKGFEVANIGDILVYARTGSSMYKRRGGRAYVRKMIKVQTVFLKLGFINQKEYLINCLFRSIVGYMPNYFRRLIYQWGIRRL